MSAPTHPRHDVSLTRGWLRDGTRLVVDAVAALPDDGLAGPSRLPGWSRAHVVAHLARNAEALGRLADWARTGVETPMYPDPATRDADIQRTARQTVPALRADLGTTAAALDEALDRLGGVDAAAWRATVRAGAAGREVRAAVVPWLRVREVWLHRVDLDLPGTDAGVVLGDAPAPLLDELLADVVTTLSGDEGCPRVDLAVEDRDAIVPLGPARGAEGTAGPDGSAGATTVRGTAVDLLLWVTGRADGRGLVTAGALPPLPRWL